MKYILTALIIAVLFSCERSEIEFNYAYSITRVHAYADGSIADSSTFYYDQLDKLIKIDDFTYGPPSSSSHPTYENDRIRIHGNQYILNNKQRIDSLIVKSGVTEIYRYSDDYIIHEERLNNGVVLEERFHQYQDGILLKDSTVIDGQYITVYKHTSTDLLTPEFIIHHTGFKEFPKRSKYLVKESIAPDHNIKVIHDYEISQNQLIDYRKSIDTSSGDSFDSEIVKYYFEEN